MPEKYGHQSTLDHTPHELFVEMDELEGEQWVERARYDFFYCLSLVEAAAAGRRRCQTVCLLRGSLLSLAPISVLLSPPHLLFGHFAADGWSMTTFLSS